MNLRTQKRICWTGAALLGAGAVVAAFCLVLLPLQTAEKAAGSVGGVAKGDLSDEKIPPLTAFKNVWSADLRRPIYDAPLAPKVEKKTAPFAAKLVGIAAEDPSDSVACTALQCAHD